MYDRHYYRTLLINIQLLAISGVSFRLFNHTPERLSSFSKYYINLYSLLIRIHLSNDSIPVNFQKLQFQIHINIQDLYLTHNGGGRLFLRNSE